MNPQPPNFIHAGALTPVTEPLCHWRFAFEDVYLRCDDTVLPGELLCSAHFIDAAHGRDDAEKAEAFRQAPFSPQWRRFPSTTLKGSSE
jgi:hypothetical protein